MRKAIVLLALSISAAFAADQTNLTIVVTNKDGKPIDRASVTIKFVAGRSKTNLGAKIRTEWDLKTSQEGVAKIPSIPQGKILIQVHVPNYQTFGQTFDVEQEEQTIEVKLNPPQAQYTAHP
jgi:hypothetical protein